MTRVIKTERNGQYDFDLPEELVAQQPAEVRTGRRSGARLLVLDRQAETVQHASFDDLGTFLKPEDVVVMNNAAVIPSILHGHDEDGTAVVANVFSPMDDGTWHCLVLPDPGKPNGTRLTFGDGATGVLLRDEGAGVWRLDLGASSLSILSELGEIAYPDYLVEPPTDPSWYQTDFASRPGAALFPSAARHFTAGMLAGLRDAGIGVVEVTNYIAPRWQPAYLRRLMLKQRGVPAADSAPLAEPTSTLPFPRSERYEVVTAAADEINRRRRRGGRVVVCGTSALRALETVTDPRSKRVWPGAGWTDLIIGPGHQFKSCDAFITNLHMPQSSELRLTSALAGTELLMGLYREVIVPERYLFNEFGDSMLIA